MNNIRWIIFALALATLYLLFFPLGIFNVLGVKTMGYPFADWVGLLASSDCQRLGFDPYTNNICDIWHRNFGYSPIWLYLHNLGISASDDIWSGVTLLLIFCFSVFFAVKPKNSRQLFFLLLIMFSTAVLLGVERNNMDLAIFSLVAGSCYLYSADNKTNTLASAAIILVAVFMKYYPVVVFGVFLLKKPLTRKDLWILLGAIITSIAYFIVFHSYVFNISSGVAHLGYGYSFSSVTLIEMLAVFGVNPPAKISAFILFVLMVTLAINMFRPREEAQQLSKLTRIQYLAGLVVTLFCFLFTENYDYRGVFLLLCLPALFQLLKNKNLQVQVTVALIGMQLFFWMGFLESKLSYVSQKALFTAVVFEQLITWVMFVLLVRLAWQLKDECAQPK